MSLCLDVYRAKNYAQCWKLSITRCGVRQSSLLISTRRMASCPRVRPTVRTAWMVRGMNAHLTCNSYWIIAWRSTDKKSSSWQSSSMFLMSKVSLMYDLIWESCYSYKSRIFFCPTKFPLIFWSVHCICLVYFQWELKWLVCCSFWVAGVCTSLSGQNILQNCNPIFGNMHEDKLWMWFNFLQFYYCVCIWKQIVVQIWYIFFCTRI